MTMSSVPETRTMRGLALFRTRGEDIEPMGRGRYLVPSDVEGMYAVDLDIFAADPRESCECPDYRYRLADLPEPAPCKHAVAASLYRAKQRAERRKRQPLKRSASDVLAAIAAMEERVSA